MEQPDKNQIQQWFDYYRKHRDRIRTSEETAAICLICGSIHVVPKEGEEGKLYCRNCGFAFYRYACPVCSLKVDGRDPHNPGCRECGWRVCTCGACHCPPGHSGKGEEP